MNREMIKTMVQDKELFLHVLSAHLIGKLGVNLSLSVTDRCRSACLHCLTNAGPQGESLDPGLLETLDKRYFVGGAIGLSCQGEPLDYEWDGTDFADLTGILARRGVKEISFLTSGMLPEDQERYRVWRKLNNLSHQEGISFCPELSFHLYWPSALGTEAAEIAKERLKYSLPLCLEFPPEVFIHLRGDLISSAANFIATFNAYFDALQELGFTQVPCPDCPHPCHGTTICRASDQFVLRADCQMTQPFGRWGESLEHLVGLDAAEQADLLQALGVKDQDLFVPGQVRWLDSHSLTSFYARTNGDVDINYSVAALGMPQWIANIFTQSYEEVIAAWGEYLWVHFFQPLGHEEEILEQEGHCVLFEK